LALLAFRIHVDMIVCVFLCHQENPVAPVNPCTELLKLACLHQQRNSERVSIAYKLTYSTCFKNQSLTFPTSRPNKSEQDFFQKKLLGQERVFHTIFLKSSGLRMKIVVFHGKLVTQLTIFLWQFLISYLLAYLK
jgi:hypothetical protein